MYEELLQPVHYISEPGDKCLTLIFTGHRLHRLPPALLYRYNPKIAGPSIHFRQTLENIFLYVAAEPHTNYPSVFFLYYILIQSPSGMAWISGKHVIDVITHTRMRISRS